MTSLRGTIFFEFGVWRAECEIEGRFAPIVSV